MTVAWRSIECPTCRTVLVDSGVGRMHSLRCPQDHGILLADQDILRVVQQGTAARIHGLVDRARPSHEACPVCIHPLHAVRIKGVEANGCASCGSLWFDLGEIRRHVHEVRSREFGDAFPARNDVQRFGADLQPTEVIAGLLAYYELEPNGSPSSA